MFVLGFGFIAKGEFDMNGLQGYFYCTYCVPFHFQIGGTYAKPVVMSPEVAIGAIGKIQV